MSLALKLLLSPLLLAQALRVRRSAPRLPEAAGDRQGQVGRGPVLRLLIVGDSSAAGVGVAHQQQALAGHLSRSLAAEAACAVHWRLLACSGITTAQALALVQGQPHEAADLAVVVLGVNDVIGRVSPRRAVVQRAELANALRERAGVRHVVFAPLPPMGRFPLLPQPLRAVIGAEARRHDAAMARWAAGRSDVSHLPIELDFGPAAMASDGFHPGEPVYRCCGEALARYIATRLLEPGFTASRLPHDCTRSTDGRAELANQRQVPRPGQQPVILGGAGPAKQRVWPASVQPGQG